MYMKSEENSPQEKVIRNIVKILNDRNITQSSLCVPLDISEGNVSKLLHGKTKLTFDMIAKIANYFSISVIDLISYPERYVKVTTTESEPVEAILQIKLKKDKKDQVLKLVFGENNIEILNK